MNIEYKNRENGVFATILLDREWSYHISLTKDSVDKKWSYFVCVSKYVCFTKYINISKYLDFKESGYEIESFDEAKVMAEKCLGQLVEMKNIYLKLFGDDK